MIYLVYEQFQNETLEEDIDDVMEILEQLDDLLMVMHTLDISSLQDFNRSYKKAVELISTLLYRIEKTNKMRFESTIL